MKIYIGSDHAGYELKEKLKAYLSELKNEVIDDGAFEYDSEDDYPDFITPVAEKVGKACLDDDLCRDVIGIIIGGSGQGEAMCANRIPGARAAVYYGNDLNIVKVTREHNNANILSLGARFINEEEAKQAVKLFIDTQFSGELRHVRRINKF